jgi:membrane-associated phospholipid phosphatase
MDSSESKPIPLPHQKHTGLWLPYQRRPALLLLLVTGLLAFLFWLPDEARLAIWVALLAQRALISMLFIFLLVALSLVWSVGQRVDSRIFLLFNMGGYHSDLLDNLMWLATQLGSMWMAFCSAFLFFMINYPRLALEIVLGTLTLWLFVETVKLLTDRARPFLAMEDTRIVGRRETGRSFPSGHTSQIFFMATILSRLFFNFGIAESMVLYLVAVMIGFTRIYMGAHYPRDVLGGALLGSVWGILAALMDPYLRGLGI